MMSNAPTNARKHVMSNIASVLSTAKHKVLCLLIGSNDVVPYGVT